MVFMYHTWSETLHKVSHSDIIGRWESHKYLFFVKIHQKGSKFTLVSDFMAISVSVDTGQHYKSSRWFVCTTYSLKRVIKHHKGDKMPI